LFFIKLFKWNFAVLTYFFWLETSKK